MRCDNFNRGGPIHMKSANYPLYAKAASRLIASGIIAQKYVLIVKLPRHTQLLRRFQAY